MTFIDLSASQVASILQQIESDGVNIGPMQVPAGAKYLSGRLIGPGGSGGGGRLGDPGTGRSGGGGGGSGGVTDFQFEIADLAALIGVSIENLWIEALVPVGNPGGLAATLANSNGTNGSSGGTTTLQIRPSQTGTPRIIARASGGGQGGGGTTTTGSAGSGGTTFSQYPGVAGSAGAAGNSSAGASSITSPSGGGGGGGISVANVNGTGGAGGQAASATGGLIAPQASGSGINLVHGVYKVPGSGAIGGSVGAFPNGAAGYRGGGGGGGAGGTPGTPPGNGGKAGDGYAVLEFIQ